MPNLLVQQAEHSFTLPGVQFNYPPRKPLVDEEASLASPWMIDNYRVDCATDLEVRIARSERAAVMICVKSIDETPHLNGQCIVGSARARPDRVSPDLREGDGPEHGSSSRFLREGDISVPNDVL